MSAAFSALLRWAHSGASHRSTILATIRLILEALLATTLTVIHLINQICWIISAYISGSLVWGSQIMYDFRWEFFSLARRQSCMFSSVSANWTPTPMRTTILWIVDNRSVSKISWDTEATIWVLLDGWARLVKGFSMSGSSTSTSRKMSATIKTSLDGSNRR